MLVGVGDSRAYLVRSDGTAELLTTDDNMATAQSAEGPAPSRPTSVSTRWLGESPAPQPGTTTVSVTGPGLLILVTDGVSDLFPTPADLAAVIDVSAGLSNPAQAARQLTAAATALGGRDDKTAVVVPLNGQRPVPAPDGGPVAIGGLSESERLDLLRLLPTVAGHLRPLERVVAGMPRGPPGSPAVMVLDVDAVRASVLAGSAGVLDRLVAFGWRDPAVAVAAAGVVVMTAGMAAEVAGHLAAGRLQPEWFERLIDHEMRHHLSGRIHGGHDEDAAAVVAGLLDARRAEAGARALWRAGIVRADLARAATRRGLGWVVAGLGRVLRWAGWPMRRLAELRDRRAAGAMRSLVQGASNRLAGASRLRWDAVQVATATSLTGELNRLGGMLDAVRDGSGSVPARALAGRVDAAVAAVEALVLTAPARGPPATAGAVSRFGVRAAVGSPAFMTAAARAVAARMWARAGSVGRSVRAWWDGLLSGLRFVWSPPAWVLEQAAAQPKRLKVGVEHRLYPTWVQEWLGPAGELVYQLLHIKLVRKDSLAPVEGRRLPLRERISRIREIVARSIYNRAATTGGQWIWASAVVPVPLPGLADAFLDVSIKMITGNYGALSVLDQAEPLTKAAAKKIRVLGAFPVGRVGLLIALRGWFRIEPFILHFDVPGRALEQTVEAPRVIGFHPMRRLKYWALNHDLSPWTWKPFDFLSQTQFGVGVGPADPVLPNWMEYRGSLQKVVITRRDGRVHELDMIKGTGRKVRAGLIRVWRVAGRLLPRPVREYVERAPAWFAARGERHQISHRRRILGRYRAELEIQRSLYVDVAAELARLRELQAGGRVPVTGPWYSAMFTVAGAPLDPRDLLAARIARLEALHDEIAAVIRKNRQSEKSVVESLTGLGASDVVALAAEPPSRRAVTQGSGALGAVSESGSPGRVNGDAWRGATSPGRMVAMVADEVAGWGAAVPASVVAVEAGITAARAQQATAPGLQVGRAVYAAAAGATTPAPDVLDADSTSYLAAVATRTGTGTEVVLVGVGDSRAYLVRPDGTAELLTTDDNMASAQTAEGSAPWRPASVSTHWLGESPAPQPRTATVAVTGEALLVLVTDGVSDLFATPADLAAAIDAPAALRDPGLGARQLADAATARGGHDDKTAVVVPLNVARSGAPDGGPVAIGGLTEGERRDLLRLLPTVADHLRPLERVVAGMPRGPPDAPPVLVLDAASLPQSSAQSSAGVLERLVAFGWRDPSMPAAAPGVVVMTEAMATEVADHLAAGRLRPEWFARLVDHEVRHHLSGEAHAGHDADAAAIVAELLGARRTVAAGPVHLVGIGTSGATAGRFVDTTDGAAGRAVREAVRTLDERGAVHPARQSLLEVAGPRGLWVTEGLDFALVDGLNAELAREPGSDGIAVVYVLDRERSRVLADTEMFGHLRGLDEELRVALEEHVLLRLRHGDPANVGTEAVTDVPGIPLRRLEGASFVRRLTGETVRGGRPKVLLLRDAGGALMAAMHWAHDPGVLLRAVAGAELSRRVGVPTAPSWPAMASEDLHDETGSTVVEAGDVLVMRGFLDGTAVELDAPGSGAQRDQVAGQFVLAGLLQDADLMRATEDDRLRTADGLVWSFDFDQSLPIGRDARPVERGLRIGSRPEIYGRLTPADVLAQLEHVGRLREWLLAGVPGGVLHRMVAARLSRVQEMVRAGRLPEALVQDLERAARSAAARYPGDPRPPGAHLPVFADQALALADAWAHQAGPPGQRELRLASDGQLRALVEASLPVQVHGWRAGLWGQGRWEISLRPQDARGAGDPWTPDLHAVDPRRVLSALRPLLPRHPAPAAPEAAPDVAEPGVVSATEVAAQLRRTGVAVEVHASGLTWVDGIPTMVGAVAGPPDDGLAERAVAAAGELTPLGRAVIWVRSPVTAEQLGQVLQRVRDAHPGAFDHIRLFTADHTVEWDPHGPPGRSGASALPAVIAPGATFDALPLWARAAAVGAGVAAVLGGPRAIGRALLATLRRLAGLLASAPTRGPPPRHRGGGPALISHRDLPDDEREIVVQVIDGMAWTDAVDPAGLDRLARFEPGEAAASGARGIRGADGFGEAVRGASGPADLVVYAGWDGWLYTDARTLAALRSGVLGPDALRALMRHELAELANGRLPQHERLPHAQLPPLPDLTPLAPVVGAHLPARPVAFRSVVDVHGRTALVAPELGAPPAALSSMTVVHADKIISRSRSSGVVVRVAGGTADVLTNRHVVDGAVRVRVELGRQAWSGSVLPAPAPGRIADALAGIDAEAAAMPREELLGSVADLDLALVRISTDEHPQVTLVPVVPGTTSVEGSPVTLVGLPHQSFPVDGPDAVWDNRTAEPRPVVAGGIAAPGRWSATPGADRWDLVIAGSPWVALGSSGGPVLAGQGVHERLVGVAHSITISVLGQDGTQARAALVVGAPAVRAYLAATWSPDDPAPTRRHADVVPVRWGDSPALAAAAERSLDRARVALDRAGALTGDRPREIAELVEQAREAASFAGFLTRRHPEPFAAGISDAEARAVTATDRLWTLLAARAEQATTADDLPSGFIDSLVSAAGRLPAPLPMAVDLRRSEHRRLFDQLLAVLAPLSGRLGDGPAQAELVELIDDAFDLVLGTSREQGEVPARWRGGPAPAAAQWGLARVERLIVRHSELALPPGAVAGLADVVTETLADARLLTLHDPGPVADRLVALQRWLVEAGRLRGPPPGGAVAVVRNTGVPTRLDDTEYAQVLHVLDGMRDSLREVGREHRAYRLADPGGAWAEFAPRLYAVPGWNAALPQRFAVVEFVAPDPAEPGRAAVFVDAEVLARLVLLPEPWRQQLADRERARLERATEDAAQAMPLPAATALLALVRPRVGYGVTTGPLSPGEQRWLALRFALWLGEQPASREGGTIVADWGPLRSELEGMGLERLRAELLAVRVVDVHGRRWTVTLRHVRAEIDRLIRGRLLSPDLDADLDAHLAAGLDGGPDRSAAAVQHAVLVARVTIARVRRDEIAAAERLDRAEATRLPALRTLLSQVAAGPGTASALLRRTVLPGSAEQARMVLDRLVASGLLRAGRSGDTYGPVDRVIALLERVAARDGLADGPVRALLDETAAVLSTRPALWQESTADQMARLLTLLTALPELGVQAGAGAPTYLDLLHTVGTTPAGVGAGELSSALPGGAASDVTAAISVLRAAGLVQLDVQDGVRHLLAVPVRRVLGDLAYRDEIEEQDYRRELDALLGLLRQVPSAADGAADRLGAVVTRLRTIEGSPLHPDADRGGLWEPGPTSYGAVLLAVRRSPGVNTVGLARMLDLPVGSVRHTARRLTTLGLVQITHRAGGGDSYLLRTSVLALMDALTDPAEIVEPAYREALLDLAELLMSEGLSRPSLAELATSVARLRETPESPLETDGRVHELYEPPPVSYLDLLLAIGAVPGSGSSEIARVLGTSADLVRGATVHRIGPRMVTVTRRVQRLDESITGGGFLILAEPGWGYAPDPESASPSRTKFTYELTELGRDFLAALRDPGTVADPHDREALHRAALLLRRNPGRDRFPMDALIDSIARLLDRGEIDSAGIPVVTRETSLRGTLDAVAAAGGFVGGDDLARQHAGAVKLRLARFADWGLLEMQHASDGTSLYRMPEHTRRLLHDLDHRVSVLDRPHRAALDALAGWFDRPASLQVGVVATRRIEDALQAVRDLPESALPAAPRVSTRQLLDVIAAGAGGTLAQLAAATSGRPWALVTRLHALHRWGLVDRWIDPTSGIRSREYRYSLPGHTRALLRDVDGRSLQPYPRYLVLLDELAARLDRPIDRGRDGWRQRTDAVLTAIRNLPGSPLPASPVTQENSVRHMLDVMDRTGVMTVGEIAAAVTGVVSTVLGQRLATLYAAGLLERLPAGARHHTTTRFAYSVPERTRRLLSDVDGREALREPDYVAALEELALRLGSPAPLKPGTAQASEFVALVGAIRVLAASPLPSRGPAPMTSYRGTLDAIGAAGEAGITAEELAALPPGLGMVPMRQRLRLLLGWDLVERVSGAGRGARSGSRVYRLPEPVRRLLAALDDPSSFVAEASKARLRALAELLNTPAAKLGPGSRQKVTEAVEAVRALPYSPLRDQRLGPRPESLRATLDALDAPGGATVAEVAAATGTAETAVRGRVFTLTEWDLVVVLSGGTRGPALRRYGLPAHTRRLLQDLDDPEAITDPGYRVAAAHLTELLARSAGLRPEQRGTRELADVLDVIRALPGGPLSAQRLHRPGDSVWATIEAVAAAPDGIGAEELTEATGMLPVPQMRHRLHVLADWGLLRIRRGAAGRKLYSVPAVTRLLLADLAEPARIADPDYRAAAERLAPLLAQNVNLLPGSPRTPELIQALAAVQELEAGPLGRGPHVPADSLRGTLLALATADRPVPAAWLARTQQLREHGVMGRLAVLHRRHLVHREIDWGAPGRAPEAVYSLTQDTRRLLAELADPSGIDAPRYRAAVEELVVLLGAPTNTETSATREVVLAGLDAVAELEAGPLPARRGPA
ncbi:trypsin-like peptidase domain-containing protein [Pseudonocardia alaniniphila]|uniref:trypsin-like peptidase domain-containing protein n=1 Tax=Pseudonocardia alaniniphila TaxID=75291 RepID=UPI0031E07881